MVRSASWQRAAIFSVLQEHQPLRARAHLVSFAVVHRCDANMRALVFLRYAEMVLDDFGFGMPHSNDVGYVLVFLFKSNGFAAYGRLLKPELIV